MYTFGDHMFYWYITYMSLSMLTCVYIYEVYIYEGVYIWRCMYMKDIYEVYIYEGVYIWRCMYMKDIYEVYIYEGVYIWRCMYMKVCAHTSQPDSSRMYTFGDHMCYWYITYMYVYVKALYIRHLYVTYICVDLYMCRRDLYVHVYICIHIYMYTLKYTYTPYVPHTRMSHVTH